MFSFFKKPESKPSKEMIRVQRKIELTIVMFKKELISAKEVNYSPLALNILSSQDVTLLKKIIADSQLKPKEKEALHKHYFSEESAFSEKNIKFVNGK